MLSVLAHGTQNGLHVREVRLKVGADALLTHVRGFVLEIESVQLDECGNPTYSGTMGIVEDFRVALKWNRKYKPVGCYRRRP